MSEPSPVPRKRQHGELYRRDWLPGDEAEAELRDVDYENTTHPVRILSIDWPNKQALVKLMAFDDIELPCLLNLDDIHPFRAPEPNYVYVVGDKVQFRMWKRRVKGIKVDGYAGDEEGIWVKGIIVEMNPNVRQEICVEYYNWDSAYATKKSKNKQTYKRQWVVRRDVRLAAY